MKNFDLSDLSYEELCELEKLIAENKKNFIRIVDCYVFDDQDGEPHLCFRSERYYLRDYYYIFYDVFTKKEVVKIGEKEVKNKDTFIFQLNKAGMHYYFERYRDFDELISYPAISYTCFKGKDYYDYKYYPLETIATLWDSVKNAILTARLDEEQAKLDEKRKKIELMLRKKL